MPALIMLTSIHARLDHLVSDTLRAQTDHERPTKEASLAAQRELLQAPDLAIPLADRYAVVNALLVAAEALLSEDMGASEVSARPYALGKLKEAAYRLG